jgi:thioredoxin
MKNVKSIIATLIIILSISCSNSQNFKSVNVETFKTTLENTNDVQLIDVRTEDEFNGGHIKNAKNISIASENWNSSIGNLDKTKPVLVYCLSGGRSKKAATELKELGFKEVIELDGGYLAWSKANPQSNAVWTGMTKEEYTKLLASDKIVVIDFYAKWCAPCKKMAPYLEKMNTELASTVTIHRIDADKNKSLFNALGYQGLPVILVYKNGKETFKKNEFVSEEELRKAL